MLVTEVGKPRGVLLRHENDERLRHWRLAPSAALEPSIAHFWMVSWDFGGKDALVAETLPHPTIQMVFEAERAAIGGPHRKKFSRRLSGTGRVFGIKFRPAAFHPLLGAPLSRIANRTISVRTVFGDAGVELARQLRTEPDPHRCTRLAEAFLAPRIGPLAPPATRVRDLVERMSRDHELLRVEQVAALAGMGLRRLQRMFRTYVGVSPKWVIQRYRLHEAAEALDAGGVRMAHLALRLGYSDQSHFIRDFKAIVGRSPGRSARR